MSRWTHARNLSLAIPLLLSALLSTATATAQHTPKTITITWWSHNNPAFVAANRDMIARFERVHTNIKVNYQNFEYTVFIRKLQAGYRAGNASDMQQMFGTWVTGYAEKGQLDPAPASLQASIGRRFWPAALGAYTVRGEYYGMPQEYNLENGGMLVNPALMKAGGITTIPTSWAALVADGQKLSKMNSKGKLTQVGFAFTNNDTITFLYLSMILQQGATYWAADGKHIDLSTTAARRAWIDLTNLSTKYRLDNEQSYTGDSFEVFFRGKAAMAMRGPWVISAAQQEFPRSTIQYEYVPVPPYKGSKPTFAAESGWGEVVNARSSPAVKAACWKFIDFMAQPANARSWAIRTFTVSALKSLRDDPALLQATPQLKTSFNVLPYGKWVGPVQDRDTFWRDIHHAFTAVELKKMKPLDALKDAEKRINSMIDQHLHA